MSRPQKLVHPTAEAVKKRLVRELAAWIRKQGTQAKAAELLGTGHSRVGLLVQERTYGYSMDWLIETLAKTGKTVTLEIKS